MNRPNPPTHPPPAPHPHHHHHTHIASTKPPPALTLRCPGIDVYGLPGAEDVATAARRDVASDSPFRSRGSTVGVLLPGRQSGHGFKLVDDGKEVKFHSAGCASTMVCHSHEWHASTSGATTVNEGLLMEWAMSAECQGAEPALRERMRRAHKWEEREYKAPTTTPLEHIIGDPRRAKAKIDSLRDQVRGLQKEIRALKRNSDIEITTTHTEDIKEVAELYEAADGAAVEALKDDHEASEVWKDHLRNAREAAAHDGKRYTCRYVHYARIGGRGVCGGGGRDGRGWGTFLL